MGHSSADVHATRHGTPATHMCTALLCGALDVAVLWPSISGIFAHDAIEPGNVSICVFAAALQVSLLQAVAVPQLGRVCAQRGPKGGANHQEGELVNVDEVLVVVAPIGRAAQSLPVEPEAEQTLAPGHDVLAQRAIRQRGQQGRRRRRRRGWAAADAQAAERRAVAPHGRAERLVGAVDVCVPSLARLPVHLVAAHAQARNVAQSVAASAREALRLDLLVAFASPAFKLHGNVLVFVA
mmetsp:Transcript_75743/g.175626  ORF Transcript_75743/g.175626 Transcript_75743/m.175626 type:complete len:239 (-) Transcript_75743:695-1411(-)